MDSITTTTMNYWEKKKVNCARATACGILDFYKNVEGSEILYNAFTTFGGGIGEKTICGSLIGALGAMNVILAERGLSDEELSNKTKILKQFFQEEFNTLECKLILDEFRGKDGQIDFSHPERRKKCTRTVINSVAGVQKVIDNLNKKNVLLYRV